MTNEINDREKRVEQFLKLAGTDKRGKLKIYIGMSAGVGKTYRMLQEAHRRLANGENIRIDYIETHERQETQALIEGLPLIQRREVFYNGKRLEEAVRISISEKLLTNLLNSFQLKRSCWRAVVTLMAQS